MPCGRMTAAKVWEGADALKRFLVAIETLEPFPGNPRRGDVHAVAESLRRFGQLRPALVDGTRIIAGHHVILSAAQELGWTHIAVIPHAFPDEDSQRAFMLADNRTHDLGEGYDDALLVEQLKALAEIDMLAGTGYSPDDLDDVLAALRALDTEPIIDAERGKREHRDPGIKELVLLFSQEQFAQVEVWLGIVAKESGTEGTSETVFAGLRVAAQTLNG